MHLDDKFVPQKYGVEIDKRLMKNSVKKACKKCKHRISNI